MVQEPLENDFTGIILAGGKGKRFGLPKAFLEIDGKRVIELILSTFSEIFPKTFVITGNYDIAIGTIPNVTTVKDIYQGLGPIGGLLTGLRHANTEWIFMTGCDYPFLKREIIEFIIQKAVEHPENDIVIPFIDGHYQVLHAAYRKSITPIVEMRVSQKRYSIKSMLKFTDVKILTISENEIKQIDPQLASFININTPEDIARKRPSDR